MQLVESTPDPPLKITPEPNTEGEPPISEPVLPTVIRAEV